MRSYWDRIGPYSNMTGILVIIGEDSTQRGKKLWRQRLDLCYYNPKDTRDY